MKNSLSILTAITGLATTSILSAEPDKPMPNSEIKVEAIPTPAELTATRCLICHGDPTAGQKRLAPPFAMMKTHYESLTEKEFITAVSGWIKEPAKQKSRMPGAINRFGLMPAVAYPDEEVAAIAKYVYDTEFPMPGGGHGKGKGHGEGKGHGNGPKGNDQHGVKPATEKVEEAVPAAPAKKWLVPAAMSVHIRNLEKSIASFESEKPADHAALATSIDKGLKQMIASCTMDGEAHETLHDWLVPLLELATEHASATELAVQKEKIAAMRGAFSTFHEKFELSPTP